MDNLYSSLDCNQFKVGAHHNIEEMVIVFADQEPALPGDVQLYGEAHLGSEAGHAVLGAKALASRHIKRTLVDMFLLLIRPYVLPD